MAVASAARPARNVIGVDDIDASAAAVSQLRRRLGHRGTSDNGANAAQTTQLVARACPQLGGLRTRTVHQRFSRWAKSGVFARIFKVLASDHDNEYMMIDATIIRAHQHSAGARKKTACKPSANRAED